MDTVVYDPYREALIAATGVPLEIAARARDRHCWPEFEIGAIDETEFARRYFPVESGLQFDLDAFHGARREGYRWLPGMNALLASLAGRVDRYLASNYPVWIDEVMQTFDLEAHFDGVFVSCRLGVRKPDPRFFEHVLAGVKHAPSECLFVDDRAENCRAAELAGMRAHVFTTAEDLTTRLGQELAIGNT